MPNQISHAGLTEPVVREIIAAFEAPQEGHELAQKLERVWPIIKRALLASVSQPQAELLARAARVYEVITSFGWDISWKHDKPIPDDAWPIDIIAAALQSEREAAAAVARRSADTMLECHRDLVRYATMSSLSSGETHVSTERMRALDRAADDLRRALASPAPQEETR